MNHEKELLRILWVYPFRVFGITSIHPKPLRKLAKPQIWVWGLAFQGFRVPGTAEVFAQVPPSFR